MRRSFVVIWLLCQFVLLYAQPIDDGYVSIDGLKKSLGVNMEFKVPEGWKEKQSDLPHIVKSYHSNGAVFNVMILESRTFISRNEFRKQQVDNILTLLRTEFRNDPDVIEFTELGHSLVNIDKYPFVVISSEEVRKSYYSQVKSKALRYYTCYEDRIIAINFFDLFADPKSFSSSVAYITASIRFPDQYSVY